MLLQAFDDLRIAGPMIRQRRYGVIHTLGGQFRKIVFRPWPKLVSGVEVNWWARHRGGKRAGEDFCRLYYSQPMSASSFLTLNFICSTGRTSLATFRAALRILDHVARTKESDAIVCEAFNSRISDRLFRRWGWEPHLLASKRRHWIKRFYGDWSSVAPLAELVGNQSGCEIPDASTVNLFSVNAPNPVCGDQENRAF